MLLCTLKCDRDDDRVSRHHCSLYLYNLSRRHRSIDGLLTGLGVASDCLWGITGLFIVFSSSSTFVLALPFVDFLFCSVR